MLSRDIDNPDVQTISVASTQVLHDKTPPVVKPRSSYAVSPKPKAVVSVEASDIASVSIEELKEVLVQHLQTDYGMLAVTLSKTTDWYESDGILHFSVQTPFEAQLLQKEKNMLAQKAAIFYKKDLSIQVTLMEEKKKKTEALLPDQVRMLCRQIKGSVVDVRTAVVAEMEEE